MKENKNLVDWDALTAPFPPGKVRWRVAATTKDKSKGMAVPYIQAPTVLERLDSVLGRAGWQNKYVKYGGTTVCELGILVNGEWLWKSDGSGDTEVEPEKGGISGSLKRAAFAWGIGRYLGGVQPPWVELEQKGRSYVIAKKEYARLRGLLIRDSKGTQGASNDEEHRGGAPTSEPGGQSGPVAQRSEQPSHKGKDAGSSPARPTRDAALKAIKKHLHDAYGKLREDGDVGAVEQMHLDFLTGMQREEWPEQWQDAFMSSKALLDKGNTPQDAFEQKDNVGDGNEAEEPTGDKSRAHKLHKVLGAVGVEDHLTFAVNVTGNMDISGLSDLTDKEMDKVYDAAQRMDQ